MNKEDIDQRALELADKHFELYVTVEDGHATVSEAISAGIEEALTTLGTPVREKGIWMEESQLSRVQSMPNSDGYINLYVATSKLNDAMVPFYSAKDSLSKAELETLVESYVAFKGYTDDFINDLMKRFL